MYKKGAQAALIKLGITNAGIGLMTGTLGAGIGALAGGEDNRLQGALIGGGLGAAGGYGLARLDQHLDAKALREAKDLRAEAMRRADPTVIKIDGPKSAPYNYPNANRADYPGLGPVDPQS